MKDHLVVTHRQARKLVEAQYRRQRCIYCGRVLGTVREVVRVPGGLAHRACWKQHQG